MVSNAAVINGRGILTSGILKVYNSTIANNFVQGPNGAAGDSTGSHDGQPGYGAGLNIDSGTVSIFNSVFSSNLLYGGPGTCPFNQYLPCGLGADANGGAIYLRSGYLEIFGSTIAYNRADGASGYQENFPFGRATSSANGFGGGI